MAPKHEPEVVSLEARRRLRAAESKARAAQAKKAVVASHEKAINWRKVPLFLAAAALMLAASWLIGKLTIH